MFTHTHIVTFFVITLFVVRPMLLVAFVAFIFNRKSPAENSNELL